MWPLCWLWPPLTPRHNSLCLLCLTLRSVSFVNDKVAFDLKSSPFFNKAGLTKTHDTVQSMFPWILLRNWFYLDLRRFRNLRPLLPYLWHSQVSFWFGRLKDLAISGCALVLEGCCDLLFFNDNVVLLIKLFKGGVRLFHRGAEHIAIASLSRGVSVDVLRDCGPWCLCISTCNAEPWFSTERLWFQKLVIVCIHWLSHWVLLLMERSLVSLLIYSCVSFNGVIYCYLSEISLQHLQHCWVLAVVAIWNAYGTTFN